ncbi:MAG: hypothetical protein UU08_C0001G0025 [Candidatus Uhrbacteria bacterium GW2011_GWE2_40_58]|nr:MAG: hypothetical protein UT94_C0001G0025 [Candidatus Uhrbacteria bacterium GW2011_GWF2_40_263]KKR68251.1 MAG: hypothetical protein UU08_C0001G0025 [Candidatus Uhrbacteria bacterium GW2011_GWE2_40_58]OGL92053.1 MAG: hypothetical protein A2239_03510 [Candidatus Uhrbacteria bacterium RIFOXYA2_FULL_40_9]OGL97511.1 MAG: hypothetical protein A2332_00215 [Candidatus Uhrbacteria bacterium RIFOXYB2_FULL_41_18]HBK35101.1 hypothetical protein [Candidatus Uhrbacteria bacterium]
MAKKSTSPLAEKVLVEKKETTPKKKSAVKKKTTPKKKGVVKSQPKKVEEKKPEVIEAPAEVRKHVVFVHSCSGCSHIPLGVNTILGICLVLIIALSTMVLSFSGVLPFPSLGSSSDAAPVSIDSVVHR